MTRTAVRRRTDQAAGWRASPVGWTLRHPADVEVTTELPATGGTTTGFVVPESVVAALGGGRRRRWLPP